MTGALETTLLISAILLLLGVAASSASSRFGIPALVLFLFVGMLAGSEGIGGIEFDDAEIAKSLGTVALVLILFAGGLETQWNSVRKVIWPGVSLATIGVVITAGIVGWVASYILNIPVMTGLLLGAVVSSTDAAAVFAVLRARSLRLKGRLNQLLELESGANDPMAVFLTISLTALLIDSSKSWSEILLLLILQIVVGLLGGVFFGYFAAKLIDNIKLDYEGLYPVISLSVALLTYSATGFLHGSGFLAVYVAGLILARQTFTYKTSLVQFHDGIAWLMQIALFLVLGLLVFPSRLIPILGEGLILSLVLVFIARPIAVIFCLKFFREFNWKEIILISWVGLRGAVPIVLSTIPYTAGVPGSADIFNVVFFIVIVSVVLQGTTIKYIASKLKVLVAGRDRLVERRVASKMFEVTIDPNSKMAGKRIVDLKIPQSSLIVLINRGSESYVPRGATVIESGDKLLITSRKQDLEELKSLFA